MKCLFVFLGCINISLGCDYIKWNPVYPSNRHVAALILARGGSKSIPLKNLALVGNKTLLGRSLAALSKTTGFSAIWVSTDHELIGKEAEKGGAKVHWRINENVQDTSTSIGAVRNFLFQHREVDYVALIQCTSPFIKAKYLQEALSIVNSGEECAFSVTRSYKLRWKRTPEGVFPLNFDPSNRPRRQDLAGEHVENGSIPATYREVFEICSNNGEPIHRDVYQKLLAQCKLDAAMLKVIWELTGPPQGLITRTNLYKTLALVAWAQQGKSPSDKLFLSFNGKEYPTPQLGDLSPVKNLKIHYSLKKNPAILGLSYTDITQLDNINIELVPEKKGIFLKHSEYIVSSRRFNSKVTRRYNDFVALYEILLGRFPYRIVPRLPPKKIVSDAHFLESRRRALNRWLTLICRHPTISHDALLSFFLTDQGPDIQYRIRDIYRRAPDEFMTSDYAANAKDLLPPDCTEFATNREQIRSLVHIIAKMKALADNDVERGHCYSRDAEDLSSQLKALGAVNIGQISSANWNHMQKGFTILSRDLNSISNNSQQHAKLEQITVCERLDLLLDVLIAHRDLCERLEKGLAQDHQTALAKMLSLKKRKIQGVIRGTDAERVEQLEAKMLTQENVISNMELRSDFSLYCVHMETQLVHAYLETLSSILNSLVALRIRTHSELAEIWKLMTPTAKKYLPVDYSPQNGNSH